MKYNLKKPLNQYNLKTRQGLMARLSEIAYQDKKTATAYAKSVGFTKTQFFDVDGAQAYIFSNKDDCVVACRGTEPTEWNDVKADLKLIKVPAETVGEVHRGFKKEVDDLWPTMMPVVKKLGAKQTHHVDIWFTGHSLGGAMATIVASRLYLDIDCPDPAELHTFGSPRVGDKDYVGCFNFTHHRHVNNNDIVQECLCGSWDTDIMALYIISIAMV